MPPFLDRVHPSRLRRALQQFVKSGDVGMFKFSTLWSILDKRFQRARYEQVAFKAS